MSDKRLLTDKEVRAFERFARSQRAASVGDVLRLLADREARKEQVRTLRGALVKSWELAGRGLSPSEPEPRERCLDIRFCTGAALEATKEA